MSQLEITSNPHKFVQNIINSNSLQNDSSLVLDNLVEINQDSPSTAELADHDSGKEATIHDFLSLSGTAGSASSTMLTVAKNGSQSSSATTQDLLQPLQKHLNPISSNSLNLLPNGFVLGTGNTQNSTVEYSCSQQQIPYALVNGTLEIMSNYQSKYKTPNVNFLSKSHVTHGMPLNKHWQKGSLEISDSNKRTKALSEDDDDDDDESMDQYGCNPKKQEHIRKSDPVQQEGRQNMDGNGKGMTPRSKHSATEQRRRSKINDRFQMLRQMLPNANQKRDKASFLLEVIQYIQMLHEKVKRYETGEHGLLQQERTKLISWDKNSGHRETTPNSSYVPLVSTLSYNTREISDSNGCMEKSPLRTNENTVAASEMMSNMSNYDNKSLVSKPASLTFPPHQSIISTSEQANSIPMFRAANINNMFGHGVFHDEVKAKSSLLSLQQSNNDLASQTSNYALDHEHEKFRSSENNLAVTNHQRSDNELEDNKRSNCQLKDLYRPDAIKHSGNNDDSSVHVSDGARDERRPWCQYDRPKDARIPENNQDPPAILGGVINISTAYSQGVLDTLTRALQSSGIDLGQATISVKIDLGKPSDTAGPNSNMTALHMEMPSSQSKETSVSKEPQEPRKRPKFEIDT